MRLAMRTLIDVSLFVHTRRAWHGKQYFTPATIVVAQSDRSSVSFLPSFLSSSSSKLLSSFPPSPSFSLSRLLVRSLTRAYYCRRFSFFTRRPSFLHMVSCVGVSPASGRNFIRFVSSIQGQTYIDSYSHVYSPRTSLVLVERANRSAGDFR